MADRLLVGRAHAIPYWEFTEHGYEVDVASPDGGALEADSWSDPRDESRYSADDLLSLGFINSPDHLKLVEQSKPLADVARRRLRRRAPRRRPGTDVHVLRRRARARAGRRLLRGAARSTAVICHATCVLLKTRLSDGTPAGRGQDLDRLRELRGAIRRRVRRPQDPAVPDRGRGAQAREHELHRQRPLQAARGARRQPDHRPAAVLGQRRPRG